MSQSFKRWVTPLQEDEIEAKLIEDILSHSLIKKHEKAIECLEAIRTFQKRKRMEIGSIESFPGTFPRLRAKSVNRIDTLNRCINRLILRYNKLMNEFNK